VTFAISNTKSPTIIQEVRVRTTSTRSIPLATSASTEPTQYNFFGLVHEAWNVQRVWPWLFELGTKEYADIGSDPPVLEVPTEEAVFKW
jgi:hypothetical protein